MVIWGHWRATRIVVLNKIQIQIKRQRWGRKARENKQPLVWVNKAKYLSLLDLGEAFAVWSALLFQHTSSQSNKIPNESQPIWFSTIINCLLEYQKNLNHSIGIFFYFLFDEVLHLYYLRLNITPPSNFLVKEDGPLGIAL